MRVYGSYGKVVKVTKFNKKNNGLIIDITLGKDKGFLKVIWTWNNFSNGLTKEVNVGEYIAIPSMELCVETKIYNNQKYTQAIGYTKMVESVPKISNKTYEHVETNDNIGDEFDKEFNDKIDFGFEQLGENLKKEQEKEMTQEEFVSIKQEILDKVQNDELFKNDEQQANDDDFGFNLE